MSEPKNIRIWQWAVILLVLCNLGLTATLLLKPRHMPPPPPHSGGPRDFVIAQLKFTEQQVARYDELINQHQGAMRHLRENGKTLREELFACLQGEHTSNNITDSLAALIGSNQKEIEMVTYNHFAQVRALCTDSQKQQFDKIIGDVIKSMNGGPGEGHPPPGAGDDGPPQHLN